MNVIRHLVSGDKYRVKDGEIDLDLTYITPRIIAMGIPGNDINIIWRNHINDVANFLHKHHENNYLIVNLSGEKYDYSKFRGTIVEFGFPDHNSPPLALLNEIVVTMDSFLNAKPENVIAVHCLAGRSRTGTIVASYLLYSGYFSVPALARQFFNENRSLQGSNVVLPSQIRYIDYFAAVMRGRTDAIQTPRRLRLKRIMFTPLPLVKKCTHMGSFTPFVEIVENVGQRLIGRNTYMRKCRWVDVALGAQIDCDTVVSGDVQIKFYQSKLRKSTTILLDDTQFQSTNPNKLSQTLLFRVTFHTSFVPKDLRLAFTKFECDAPQAGPLDNHKFSEDFRVTLIFDEPSERWIPTDEFRIAPEDIPRPIDARPIPMTDSMRSDAASILANNGKQETGSNIVRNLKQLPSPKFKPPPAETPGSLELSALSLDTDQRLPKWGNRSNDLTDKRTSAAPNVHREAPAQMHRVTASPTPSPSASPANSAAKNPPPGALRHDHQSSPHLNTAGVYSSAPIQAGLESSVAPMIPKRAGSDASSMLPSTPNYNPTDLGAAYRKPSRTQLRDLSPSPVPVLAPPPTASAARLSREGSNTTNRVSTPSTPSTSTPSVTPSSSCIQFPSAPATTFVQLPTQPTFAPQPQPTAFVQPPTFIPSAQPFIQPPTFAPSSQPPTFAPPTFIAPSPQPTSQPSFLPPSQQTHFQSSLPSPSLPAPPTFNPDTFLATNGSQKTVPPLTKYTSPPPASLHALPPVQYLQASAPAPSTTPSFPLDAALAYRTPTGSSDLFRKPFLADPKEAPSVPPTFVPFPSTSTPKSQ